jgi:hypothetical protein
LKNEKMKFIINPKKKHIEDAVLIIVPTRLSSNDIPTHTKEGIPTAKKVTKARNNFRLA